MQLQTYQICLLQANIYNIKRWTIEAKEEGVETFKNLTK